MLHADDFKRFASLVTTRERSERWLRHPLYQSIPSADLIRANELLGQVDAWAENQILRLAAAGEAVARIPRGPYSAAISAPLHPDNVPCLSPAPQALSLASGQFLTWARFQTLTELQRRIPNASEDGLTCGEIDTPSFIHTIAPPLNHERGWSEAVLGLPEKYLRNLYVRLRVDIAMAVRST